MNAFRCIQDKLVRPENMSNVRSCNGDDRLIAVSYCNLSLKKSIVLCHASSAAALS